MTAGANRREIEQQQQRALEAQFAGRDGESEEATMERIQKDPEVCLPFFPSFFSPFLDSLPLPPFLFLVFALIS